jgi:endonuclease YncB( thermonuclease family)
MSPIAYAQPPQPISGKVVAVFDGDTFEIDKLAPNGKRIHVRLRGIDAPEKKQMCAADGAPYPCGRFAGNALLRKILGASVMCHPEGSQSYGRVVAICYLGNRDINQEMVRDGWAVAYSQYTTKYIADEADARQAKRGVWKGTIEYPQCFRHPYGNGCPCQMPTCSPR